MLPHTHFMGGLLVGLAAVKLGIINIQQAILIAILTTAIDLDHLISSYKKFKTWNPIKCWNASIKSSIEKRILELPPLHKNTALLAVILISLIVYKFYPTAGFIMLAAYIPHYLIDYIARHTEGKREKMIKIKKIFISINTYEITLDIALIILILLLFL